MSDEHAAAVYAGALFAAARDADAVARVRADLDSFATAFAETPELRRALFDPKIDQGQKEGVLAALTEGADPRVVTTVRLLLTKGRLGILGALVREYDRLAERAAGLVEIEVTSAIALPEPAEDELRARMQTVTGRRVRLVKRVDESLLGGLSLRIGDDLVVDASVRAGLERLHDGLAGISTRGATE